MCDNARRSHRVNSFNTKIYMYILNLYNNDSEMPEYRIVAAVPSYLMRKSTGD